MSSTSDTPLHVPFGVGSIISESFAIFFGNIVKVLIIGALLGLIGMVIKGGLFGFSAALVDPEQALANFGFAAVVFSTLVDLVMFAVMTAMLVLLAYDTRRNRRRPIGQYFGPALRAIVPITVLSIVASLLIGIGFVLLIVPGLWLIGVLSAIIPAILIEKSGFGAIARSVELTKGYRWPIVGMWVIMMIISGILGAAVALVIGLIGSFGIGVFGAVILMVAVNGLQYGLLSTTSALAYARLREIKDGVLVDDIASVFD